MSAERDDIIEYSLYNHHSEEEGVKKRKTILKVTIILAVITAVEVLCGAFIKQGGDLWHYVKYFFIVLTVIKAAYIVLNFMHLGDEVKVFRDTVLYIYLIFILFLVILCLIEGTAVGGAMNFFR